MPLRGSFISTWQLRRGLNIVVNKHLEMIGGNIGVPSMATRLNRSSLSPNSVPVLAASSHGLKRAFEPLQNGSGDRIVPMIVTVK